MGKRHKYNITYIFEHTNNQEKLEDILTELAIKNLIEYLKEVEKKRK